MSALQKQTIAFSNGNSATAVFASAKTPVKEVAGALALSPPKALILSIGGAGNLSESVRLRLTQLYSRGVAKAAVEASALIIDGGTRSGIMSLMGEGVAARGNQTTLLGVAPAGKIALPEDEHEDRTPLEANHTHFVLVDGTEWGAETPLLFGLVRWFTAAANGDETAQSKTKTPAVAILSGGGEVTKQEVLQVVRQHLPLLIVAGSGGFADEIATACKQIEQPVEDPVMAEIIADGKLHFHLLTQSVNGIERLIVRALGVDKVLLQAWEIFAAYDLNANLQQKRFYRLQLSIVALSVVATALVVLQQVFAPRENNELKPVHFAWSKDLLWWLVYYLLIAIPILLTVLIAASNRFKQGQKWLFLRTGAEAMKREIYSYRVRNTLQPDNAGQKLARRMEEITRQTMQTDANQLALVAYDKSKGFPPDMHAAKGGDDGFSPLTPDQYVDVRLGDQLEYFMSKTAGHEKRLKWLSWAILLTGGIGAFSAAIGLQVWVALTSSLVAAIGTYLGYRQTENTLIKFNQIATDLANIKAWWNALSAEEQASSKNVDTLVRHTERVLQSEQSGWLLQMQNALAELRKNQEAPAGPLHTENDEQENATPTRTMQGATQAKQAAIDKTTKGKLVRPGNPTPEGSAMKVEPDTTAQG